MGRGLPAVIAAFFLLGGVASAGGISNTPLSPADRGAAQTAVSGIKTAQDAKWGDAGALDKNAAQPIVSGTLMTTVDGTKSWNPANFCASSAIFLHFDALPTGGGDLTSSILQFTDTTNPTLLTYSHVLPRISGVCLDGFISCDAGTWANCKFYQWTSTTDGKISETLVGPDILSGCNCINASCSYPLLANSPMLMDRLASGMAATIMKTNTNLIIGKATVNSTTIDLAGQTTDKCGSTSGSASAITSISPGNIASAGAAAATASSIYAPLYALSQQSQGTYTSNVCQKAWTFDVGPQTIDIADSGTGYLCVVTDALAGMLDKGGNIYNLEINASTNVAYPGCGANGLVAKSYDMTAIGAGLSLPSTAASAVHFLPTGVSYQISYIPAVPGSCSATPMVIASTNFSSAFTTCTAVANNIGDYSYTGQLRFQYDNFIRSFSDNCAVYENDPACTLSERWEYDALGGGTQTWKTYNPTGLATLPSTVTKIGTYGTYTETRSAWRIVSTYHCVGTTAVDFKTSQDKAIKRSKAVQSNLSTSGPVSTYQDEICDAAGNCTTSTGSINFSSQVDASNATASKCVPMCKVTVPATVTGANSLGNQQQQTTSTQAIKPVFKVCVSGICPAAAGDTIVPFADGSICGCPDEFGQTSATIAALVAAGQNQICSTGVKK